MSCPSTPVTRILRSHPGPRALLASPTLCLNHDILTSSQPEDSPVEAAEPLPTSPHSSSHSILPSRPRVLLVSPTLDPNILPSSPAEDSPTETVEPLLSSRLSRSRRLSRRSSATILDALLQQFRKNLAHIHKTALNHDLIRTKRRPVRLRRPLLARMNVPPAPLDVRSPCNQHLAMLIGSKCKSQIIGP